jgi:ribosomal-protein-alanine N-acetyltransferase
MNIIVQTPRMVIREFLPQEEDTYLSHFNDEMVIQYIPKRSRDERINIFRTALSKYPVDKKSGIWGMFNKADGDFIGSCLLRPFNNDPGVLEIGYSVERKYWGTGIGTEMALAMVAYSFSDENISEVVALTDLENIGSQRVLEKAGLKRKDNLFKDGEELAYFKIPRLGINNHS